MGNMANGGHNRNQCPMCRDAVYDANNLDEMVEAMVERAARSNQELQDELVQNQQHRDELTAEYMRVMSMNMQIGLRHNEEHEARDALERRAHICGLNERIATVVSSACNNDVRHNPSAAVHLERQMRDLCMNFGCMAYDAQYDDAQHQNQYQHQYQNQYQYQADLMEVD
jgi:Zn-finger nucleic acid-binding protein